MNAYYNWLNSLVNHNKSEFAAWPQIKWLNPYIAEDFQKSRDQLLSRMEKSILFKNTKPYYQQISNGCQICGSGKWSCLFITNKCNASCFYCPARQDQDELPSTQGLDFDNPTDYAHYVKHFGFKGVSFSGGEPLLYFDRTLEYLKAVRKICGKDIYIWMYTNGILADKEKMQKLAEEGLNEIRFDIGATAYNLDKVKLAKGVIPVVTVEIPAVPEDKEKLLNLLPQIVEAGVHHLNLHQMRLTAYNADKVVKRGYTIIHAEKPIVMESELTALEVIQFAKEKSLKLGINYCSFHFKNRFQKAGFRNIVTENLKPGAFLTANGYLREFKGIQITYKSLKLFTEKPLKTATKELHLNGKVYFIAEKTNLTVQDLSDFQISMIKQLLSEEPNQPPDDPLLFKIWQMEYIEIGLRKY
jgi:hypothetical protein